MKKSGFETKDSPPGIVLVFLGLCIIIILVGVFYYQNYKTYYRKEVDNKLTAIADLKARDLVQWRTNQIANASVFYTNVAFSKLVYASLHYPGDTDAKAQLSVWLNQVLKAYEFDQIIIFDESGARRFTFPDGGAPVDAAIQQQAQKILSATQVFLGEFYLSENDLAPHLAVFAPLLHDDGAGGSIGVLVLRIDPGKFLYPYLSRWPEASQSAETLLVRREDDHVLFLNQLRFDAGAALRLSFPLSQTSLPAAKAVLGERGIVEGVDYRGTPVIADLRPIPDSAWFLITRMDRAEVYAPLYERLRYLILLVCALLGSVVLVGRLVWRRHTVRLLNERYQAAKALNESERRYQQIVETLPIAVAIHAEGKILYYNHAAIRLIGASDDQALRGKSIAEFMPPEEQPLVSKLIEQAFSDGIQPGLTNLPLIEQRLFRVDGSSITVETSAVLIDYFGQPALMIMMNDITERKRAVEALSQSEERLRAFFASGIFGAVMCDMKGNISFANHEFLRITGYSEDDLNENRVNWIDLTPPEFLPLDYAAIEQAKTMKGCSPYEKQYIRKDGSRVWVLVGFTMVGAQSEDMIAFVLDLTSMKQKEDEIRQLNTALEERVALRTEQLENANQELEAFAYSVSHDLRAPLRAINGYSHIVLDEYAARLDEEGQRFLRNIQENVDKMDQLITDLLALSRASRIDLLFSAIDMASLARSTFSEAAPPEILDTFRLDLEALPPAHGDPTLMRQVWTNLLSNAIKYTLPQKERHIEIGSYREKNAQVYYVRDNGVGFDPAYTHKMFGVFERLHSADEFAGTGVGLAIVKRIVQRHGGRVWAEGRPGEGATIFFSLPERTGLSS